MEGVIEGMGVKGLSKFKEHFNVSTHSFQLEGTPTQTDNLRV
jgi:hypothetical protein